VNDWTRAERKLFLLLLTAVVLGGTIGCIASGNFLGAAVWACATAIFAWVAAHYRVGE
jgi:hypothetical protein